MTERSYLRGVARRAAGEPRSLLPPRVPAWFDARAPLPPAWPLPPLSAEGRSEPSTLTLDTPLATPLPEQVGGRSEVLEHARAYEPISRIAPTPLTSAGPRPEPVALVAEGSESGPAQTAFVVSDRSAGHGIAAPTAPAISNTLPQDSPRPDRARPFRGLRDSEQSRSRQDAGLTSPILPQVTLEPSHRAAAPTILAAVTVPDSVGARRRGSEPHRRVEIGNVEVIITAPPQTAGPSPATSSKQTRVAAQPRGGSLSRSLTSPFGLGQS